MSRLLRSRQSESGEGAGVLRKLGIIGGTSWSSTALYYDYINRGIAQRLGGFHSARLTIESVDFADLIALEYADDWDGVAKLNIDAAQRLQAAGADGVLMACNTTHKVYDAVAANVDVPAPCLRRAPRREHPASDRRLAAPAASSGLHGSPRLPSQDLADPCRERHKSPAPR